MMSEVDGYETCRRLKADEVTKDIPVMFMSALSETVDKVKGFEVGGVDYIMKPCKPFRESEVFDLLRKHLGILFVYEEDTRAEPSSSEGSGFVLTSESFAALPEGLRGNLEEEAELVDIDVVLNVIEQIRQDNIPLADALTHLVKNYRFDILQQLLEEAP